MEPVVLECPQSGDLEASGIYLRVCVRDSQNRGESPVVVEPESGWYRVARRCVVYTDFGISAEMESGIQEAKRNNLPVEYRVVYTSR